MKREKWRALCGAVLLRIWGSPRNATHKMHTPSWRVNPAERVPPPTPPPQRGCPPPLPRAAARRCRRRRGAGPGASQNACGKRRTLTDRKETVPHGKASTKRKRLAGLDGVDPGGGVHPPTQNPWGFGDSPRALAACSVGLPRGKRHRHEAGWVVKEKDPLRVNDVVRKADGIVGGGIKMDTFRCVGGCSRG